MSAGGDKRGGPGQPGGPGRVLNLRHARKRRARDEARKLADANAVRHGTPRAERARLEAEAARVTRLHDGHRRETGPDSGSDDDG